MGLHPNDVWSGSYFTVKMKELAVRCGFNNPLRCTGQGKRAEGISKLVNSKEKIPIKESMAASRHDSVTAHLGYVIPDEEAHSKRYRALAGHGKSFVFVRKFIFICNSPSFIQFFFNITDPNADENEDRKMNAAEVAAQAENNKNRMMSMGMGGMGMGMGAMGMGMGGLGMVNPMMVNPMMVNPFGMMGMQMNQSVFGKMEEEIKQLKKQLAEKK